MSRKSYCHLFAKAKIGEQVGKGRAWVVDQRVVEIVQRVAPRLDDGVVAVGVAGAGLRDVLGDDDDHGVGRDKDFPVDLGELREPGDAASQIPRDEPVRDGDVAAVDDVDFVVEVKSKLNITDGVNPAIIFRFLL